MKKIVVPIIIFTYVIVTGCYSSGVRYKGNGNITEENREVFEFNKIRIDGVAEVILTQSDKEEVWVETDENLQQYVHIYNSGNTLVVDTEDDVKFTKNSIYISFKKLNEIDHNGVGSTKTGDFISTDKMYIEADGVGNTDIQINCEQLTVHQTGVGSMKLKGRTTNLDLKNTGVGSVNAFSMEADYARVENSGVGSTEVMVNKEISVNSSGVGSVKYKGDALIKDINSSGIGNVKKVN